MNRFNLTFSGEIQTGLQPEDVKLRFAEKFAIDDTERLENFFTGQTIILRRNLDRKDAAQCFREMHQIGVVAELVQLTAEETAAALADNPDSNSTPDTDSPRASPLGRAKKGGRKAVRKSSKGTKSKTAPKVQQINTDKTPANGDNQGKIASAADSLTAGQAKQSAKEQQAEAKAKAKEKAGQDEERKKERAEAQRVKALHEQAQASSEKEQEAAEIAKQARQQAEQETAQVKAEREKDLQEKEQLEAQARAPEAKEAEALRKAEEQRQALIAEEQQAQRQREQQEKKRLKAEQAARRKAEKAQAKAEKEKEAAQQALARVEEQVRQTLQAEEQKHLAAIETVQREAKRQEQLRLEAQEQARLAAEKEQQKAQQAEKAERTAADKARRAAKAEAERKQAEQEKTRLAEVARQREAARMEALEDAERKAEREEAALKRAEEEQRRAQVERDLAEKARRQTQELTERNAQLEKEYANAAEKVARLETELAIQQHREAERSAREKAALEEQRKQQEQRAAAQQLALAAENTAAQTALEDGPVARASSALAASTALKPARASVRTSLDVPQRKTGASVSATRKQQAGEPNLYTLRPFRNTPEVRLRAMQAAKTARRYAIVGAVALAALLALSGAYLSYSPPPAYNGTDALAASNSGELLLVAGDALFLHDRSGTGTGSVEFSALGLNQVTPPLAYDNDGSLLLTGHLGGDSGQLLRCDPGTQSCARLPELPAEVHVTAFAVAPLNGQLLLLDGIAGELLKTDSAGRILARTTLSVPPEPHVTIEFGLLMLNSQQAPAISVLRYDNSAFGQQLDEILLLPAVAVKAGHSRVANFVLASDNWWVTLFNPDTGNAALYRFDNQWNYLGQTKLATAPSPLQIVKWGDKTLINDPATPEILRFNSKGMPEKAFRSESLDAAIKQRQHNRQLTDSSWRLGLLISGLLALLGLAAAYHQNLRHRVYKSGQVRGADPVDDFTDDIQWVEHFPNRQAALRARGISYCVLGLALLLLAAAQQASTVQIAALLLMLSGPAIALLLYARNSPGHLGLLDNQLILVEPAGMYHMGSGANILFRGGFLFMDDVTLFMGNRLLPAFSTSRLQAQVQPLVQAGIRVDRKTLLVRLLQSGHPLARGGFAILLCSLAALCLLVVEGFF